MSEPQRHISLDEGDSFVSSWGARFAMEGGTVINELPRLTSVGIHNLAEVKEHEVVRIAGMTSHFVQFHDGGYLRFAFNERGQLVELSGFRIRATFNRTGQMVVGAYGTGELPM